jgi:hypothetical protein
VPRLARTPKEKPNPKIDRSKESETSRDQDYQLQTSSRTPFKQAGVNGLTR